MIYGTVGVGVGVDIGDQRFCLPASLPGWRKGDFWREDEDVLGCGEGV